MKKVLVIVYYWPPSGGAGVQRWLKFVKYLPGSGWQPTVITTTDGDYPAIDESLCREVPAGIKVIQTQTPTFGKLFKKVSGKNSDIPYGSLETTSQDNSVKKILIWLRLNIIIPDARRIWNKHACKAAKKELLTNKYDAVVTSGPPHSTHLIGYKLKKQFNLKWIADFRDPWTKMGYLENVKRSKLTIYFDKLLENKIVENCDNLLSSSALILNDFGNSEKMYLLRNGFDQEDFENIRIDNKSETFSINYFGTIPIESNPESVLKAVYSLRKKGLKNIEMNFWGNVCREVKNILTNLDKDKIINFKSYISHKEMIRLMVNSSLLLLIINNVKNNFGIITGKIYEYIGSRRPIIGIGPPDGEAAGILQETDAGKMFDYDKIEEIADFIEVKYCKWQAGKAFSVSNEIGKYSRKKQTKILVEILEQIN